MSPTPKKLKILYLITKSNFGGAQKYVYELACAARDSGHDVIVAYGGTGEKAAKTGLLAEKLQAAGIQTFTVSAFMRSVSLLSDFKAFSEVYRLLRQERPDVLHVSSSKAGGIGAAAGRLARVPRIVFTSHGLTIDETWRPWYERALIYVFTWLTLRLAHHSIMISNDTYERARNMPGLNNRVSLVFNGVSPFEMSPRSEARSTLAPNAPADAFWIGGIGELHINKNWSAAIRAVNKLPPSVHLVVIGEGEERVRLTALAQELGVTDRVHLVGYKDGKHFLNTFDIFLLPSLKEGLPYVLLEAGLARLPVIASDLPGVHDVIINETSGLLIQPEPNQIVSSVTQLMNDREKSERLSCALYKHVNDAFAMDKMVAETFAIYSAKMPRD